MKHTVIIGGGYAGVATLRRLARDKNIKVTLIDKNPYHFLQTEGYELVAGTTPFDATIVNLQTLCASYGENIRFIHQEIKHINFDSKKVLCNNDHHIDYDYLVIAAGSMTRFFDSVEGLRSSSHGIKNLKGAFKMKQFFEKELLLRLENVQQAQVHYSVVIGGAGLSGVEIAAEMQYYFNHYYQSNTLACNVLQIHLISGSSTVLKGLHPSVIKKAEKRLENLGVIIHTGSHIKKVENHQALLENGKSIPFDFMIFTGGIVPTSIVKNADVNHNHLGQIIVDAYLHVPNKEDVFAVGDAAEIRDKNNKLLPDTAQIAIKSGHLASHNIKRLIRNESLHPNRIEIKGLAIALGGKYAILDLNFIQVYGRLAYYVKKTTEKLYKYPLWLRCRYGFKKIGSCNI
jgi:NADH dehydrogenase